LALGSLEAITSSKPSKLFGDHEEPLRAKLGKEADSASGLVQTTNVCCGRILYDPKGFYQAGELSPNTALTGPTQAGFRLDTHPPSS
jgi:hypothetical protein